MPYSDSRLDNIVKQMLQKLAPKTILDIGPGYGKYSRLVREVLPPETIIEAVEIDKSYIKKFNLTEHYNKVHNLPVQKFIEDGIDKNYDLIIFGDVIEHLKKSEGIDAVNFFVYRSKNILIQWPHGYIQNTWEGREHEAHISVWGKSDFLNFDYKWYEKDYMRLVLINGYVVE